MGKLRKTYETKFKENIVKLYESGIPVKKLAIQYGCTEAIIYKWIDKYGHNTKKKNISSDEKTDFSKSDIERLQKEIDSLKEDNEILKKAMTIFAQK
jgi:transposase